MAGAKRNGPSPGKLRPLGLLRYAEFRAGTGTSKAIYGEMPDVPAAARAA